MRKIIVARKDHPCCQENWHTIRKGDRYLLEVCPPWHEFARAKKFETIRSCIRCATKWNMLDADMRKELGITEEESWRATNR
jgi:hypothetical protein